eukprot:comp12117_c0_seq2/m.6853 comp12117_c0_seq2/g.6853  ORF comp12117_c0_seq2/g.6853 comp12117_c0_seq2/m.6853 type:complete len:133 (-) comp12117_c0_seq2:347-745(-)
MADKQAQHHWSKDSKAKEAADSREYDIWAEYDVNIVYQWLFEAKTRIPNKTNTKGGRLHKLINTMYNSCDYAKSVIDSNPEAVSRLESVQKETIKQEIYRNYMAPLAQKVLEILEDEEAKVADSDEDDDDYY